MKQFGLFGEEKPVESKNEKLAQQVLPVDAHDAICAAIEARENPYDALVKTRAGTMVTIRQAEDGKMTGPNRISDLMATARERVRVQQALDAGEDPYADDYHVPAHEVMEALFECLTLGEDPEELEFTCYHPEVPNSERTIKLSECVYIGADELTWAQMLGQAEEEVKKFNDWQKQNPVEDLY